MKFGLLASAMIAALSLGGAVFGVGGYNATIIGFAALAAIPLIALWAERRRRLFHAPDLQEVIGAIPAPIAVYDRAERLVYHNDLYGEHHAKGLAQLRASGRTMRPTYADLVLAGAPDHLTNSEKAAYLKDRLAQQPPADGQFIERRLLSIGWLRVAHRPLPGGGSIRLAIDVNEVKEKQEELETALVRTQAAEAAQSNFMANMSHELRTPLNGVLGMVSLMRQGDTAPAQARQLDVIESSGMHLLNLITQVLDYTKMEASPPPNAPQAFDLHQLVSDVIEAAAAADGSARLNLTINPNCLPMRFSCPVQARQIVGNLVENAIKFAPDTPIDVRVSEPRRGRVRVEVEDGGDSVPVADRSAIFAKFYQRSTGITRSHGGVGLGLSICRKLVASMDGAIGVEDGSRGGALFWFEIEAPRVGDANMTTAAPAPAPIQSIE